MKKADKITRIQTLDILSSYGRKGIDFKNRSHVFDYNIEWDGDKMHAINIKKGTKWQHVPYHAIAEIHFTPAEKKKPRKPKVYKIASDETSTDGAVVAV